MFHIDEYHKILRDYNIEEKNGHLLVNRKGYTLHKIARNLFIALGDLRADNKNFRLKKSPACNFSNCVSPQCYSLNLKANFKNSLLSNEDIIAISSEMDLNRIEEIGMLKYLEEYNRTLPEILKISMEDFRTIYAYMKGTQKW